MHESRLETREPGAGPWFERWVVVEEEDCRLEGAGVEAGGGEDVEGVEAGADMVGMGGGNRQLGYADW